VKLFKHMKDGGPESKVDGWFLIEAKSLFSVVLLHFSHGSREAYHNHAFNATSWLLKGKLNEYSLTSDRDLRLAETAYYTPSFTPIKTPRSKFHKVFSVGDTWAISFRGPWKDQWNEFLPKQQEFKTLTHGRKVVA
jgi:hypothetical protein